jgi:hypothetical protein
MRSNNPAAVAVDVPEVITSKPSAYIPDAILPNAWLDWVMGREHKERVLEGLDSFLSGPEQLFLTTCVVAPLKNGRKFIAVVAPSLDVLKRAKRFLELFELKVLSFDLAPTKAEKRAIWNAIDSNHADVLIMAPGRMASEQFRDRMKQKKVDGYAILHAEEASPWSYRFNPSFRTAMRHLPTWASQQKLIHICAVERRIEFDISRLLRLNQVPKAVLSNELIQTPHVTGVLTQSHRERIEKILEFIARHDCQGVIYASTLQDMHITRKLLEDLGEAAVAYRSNINDAAQAQTRRLFEQGELRLVIALGPFLSVLERAPGLEFVAFHGMPSSLEFMALELMTHETATPVTCLCLSAEQDFFHHRFAVDKSFPDSLTLRETYYASKDIFGRHLSLSIESLSNHLRVATKYPTEDIELCIKTLLREGILEHCLATVSDTIHLRLVMQPEDESDFWHEYPLRKLEQIARLEKTRDFVTTHGDLGPSLRSILNF